MCTPLCSLQGGVTVRSGAAQQEGIDGAMALEMVCNVETPVGYAIGPWVATVTQGYLTSISQLKTDISQL